MKSYNLNIAGYNIRFESAPGGPDLVPEKKYLSNLSDNNESEILIRVFSGELAIPWAAKMVFNAPYVEEVNGLMLKKNDKFWDVRKHNNDLYIYTVLPGLSSCKNGVLKFSLIARTWELWLNMEGNEADPMEYPMDGLILYYLTVIHGDIMIHASGVNHAGRGYLFTGISGRGKSTMATLWDKSGAYIIHDDRLILRKNANGYFMYNSPVYNNDTPRESKLHRIFLINHGKKNRIVPVRGASAVSRLMANCIQHNWDNKIIARLLGSLAIMCSTIPVAGLFFRPDRSIIDFILENE